MIKLINGNVQNASGKPLNGSLTLLLTQDATVIASPGTVVSAIPITFPIANGNLVGTCSTYSNFELTPQTQYIATYYDQNGSKVSQPLLWQFTQVAGSTVDIGTMVNLASSPGVAFASPVLYTLVQGGSLQTALNSVAAAGGGTVIVPANYTETLTANLVFSANNCGILFLGPAQITMGSFQIVIPDGARGIFIRGLGAVFGGLSAFGGVACPRFIYTGTATVGAAVIGTSGGSSQAGAISFWNFTLDLTGAGTNAIGIDTYGLNQADFHGVTVIGSGSPNGGAASNNQIGLRMNVNAGGDGEAGTFVNCAFGGTNIGVQLNSVTYKTFVETNVAAWPGFSGASGFDFESAAAIRVLGGGTSVSYATAYNFGGTASINYVVAGAESSAHAAVFGASTSNNTVIATNGGNLHDPTDAGSNNLYINSGNTVRSLRGLGGSNSGWVISAPGFPALGIVASGGVTNSKNWDILGQSSQLAFRAVSDDNVSLAQPALTFNRGSGATIVSVVVGNNTASAPVPFQLDTQAFSNLPGSPTNGMMLYCSNCTIANPCASGGNGAVAKRINGAWVCN